MPRKLRIDLTDYHHVVNRSAVFIDENNYETFLKIVCKASRTYRVVLHDYCLMTNYFYLLIETEMENIFSFMKQTL